MFQFGAFCPIFRAHGSETPREIWRFGEFADNLIKFDNLRYRLLPYIYSQAWRVTNENYTMMRGLPMDFANDQKTFAIADQFMFGPAVMVCPVTDYMLHRPPEKSVLVTRNYFQTADGQPGLNVKYYRSPDFADLAREQVEPEINHLWYTGGLIT
jgi:alpha-D-xyloside xylohydrolase